MKKSDTLNVIYILKEVEEDLAVIVKRMGPELHFESVEINGSSQNKNMLDSMLKSLHQNYVDLFKVQSKLAKYKEAYAKDLIEES